MERLQLVLAILFFVAIYACVIAMVRAQTRNADGTPRAAKKQQKYKIALFCLLLLHNVFSLSLGNPPSALIIVNLLLLGGGLLWLVYNLSRPPREAEARANYRARPDLCGCCDYDLTGNTSGVCPECGWKLNNDLLPMDSPRWAIWWRGWRIESLENWRRTLVLCVAWMLGFVVVSVIFFWRLGLLWPLAGMTAFVAVHFALNAVRVWQYGRSHSSGSTQPPGPQLR
ncbi:MAG TPA: hypothetical protein PLQ89_01300 [Phycisphaerae bacterium]|nr:hypothetical protein [Phycisphaerae bacterium]